MSTELADQAFLALAEKDGLTSFDTRAGRGKRQLSPEQMSPHCLSVIAVFFVARVRANVPNRPTNTAQADENPAKTLLNCSRVKRTT